MEHELHGVWGVGGKGVRRMHSRFVPTGNKQSGLEASRHRCTLGGERVGAGGSPILILVSAASLILPNDSVMPLVDNASVRINCCVPNLSNPARVPFAKRSIEFVGVMHGVT